MGDEWDIHPKVKRPVGERLTLLALRHLYGKDVLADAPRATAATREGSRITVTFDNAGEGLVAEGDSINALEMLVAGESVPFKAHTIADRLEIELVDAPTGEVRIRFAQSNWYCVNLYNSAHIPALPFEVICV